MEELEKEFERLLINSGNDELIIKYNNLKLSNKSFNENDILTNGVYDIKLDSKPRLTADIIYLYNEVYCRDLDISGYKIKE